MEETHASQKMAKIDLINSFEKISSNIPDRILKLEGLILKENQKEHLEIPCSSEITVARQLMQLK